MLLQKHFTFSMLIRFHLVSIYLPLDDKDVKYDTRRAIADIYTVIRYRVGRLQNGKLAGPKLFVPRTPLY